MANRRARFWAFILFFILGLILPIIISTAVRPLASRNDMPGENYRSDGIFNPRPTVYGLLDPETTPDGITYRWTTSHATLTFPYAANLGQFADFSVRLSSNRPSGQPPARVIISLNGNVQPSFDVPNAFEVYSFTLDARQLPNPYLDPTHVQLDIESTTYNQSPDRSLGVAVDWIELQPRRSLLEITLSVLAWVSSLVVIMLIALSRLSLPWALAYGFATLLTLIVANLTYTIRAFPPFVETWLVSLAWVMAVWLTPTRRPVVGFALAGICLWVALAGRLLRDWQMDDAYISYRYAWNLVHGNGLVYNQGEVVEGYTNFLWTLVAAATIAAGLFPAGVILALIIALSIGLVGLTYHLGVRLASEPTAGGITTAHLWALLSAVVLALDSSFITYGSRGSGIEAVPFAFMVLLAAALIWWPHMRRAHLICGGIALALASLTRPEGFAVAAIFIVIKAWSEWRNDKADTGRNWRAAWTAVIQVSLPYLLIVVPYHIWRLSFYHYPFPNTFYAKTGTSLAFLQRGWNYTWQIIVDHWFVVLLMLLGVVSLIVGAANQLVAKTHSRTAGSTPGIEEDRQLDARNLHNVQPAEHTTMHAQGRLIIQGRSDRQSSLDRSRDVIVAMAVTVVLYSLYIVVIGGDHFPAGRFFVPLLAPMVLLAQEAARLGISRFAPAGRIRSLAASALTVGLVAYFISCTMLQDAQGPLARRTNRDTNFVNIWGSAGLWLRDHTPDDTWAASPVAGAIAYYSERRVVDMLGINDLHIGHAQIPTMGSGQAGHEKQDPVYVLDKQPRYILPYPNYFVPVEERFSTEYITTTVRGPLGPDIIWWEHRDTEP